MYVSFMEPKQLDAPDVDSAHEAFVDMAIKETLRFGVEEFYKLKTWSACGQHDLRVLSKYIL